MNHSCYFYAGSIAHLLEVEEERKGFARFVQLQINRFKEPVYSGVMLHPPAPLLGGADPVLFVDDGDVSDNDDGIMTPPQILQDLLDDEEEDLLRGTRKDENVACRNNTNDNYNTTNIPQAGCWTAFCFRWRHDDGLQ